MPGDAILLAEMSQLRSHADIALIPFANGLHFG